MSKYLNFIFVLCLYPGIMQGQESLKNRIDDLDPGRPLKAIEYLDATRMKSAPKFESNSITTDKVSTDWTQFGSGTYNASSLCYSPDGVKLYGAKGSAIYESADNGKEWTEIFIQPDHSYQSAYITELKIHPSEPGILYFNIGFTPDESVYGIHSLNLTTFETSALYTGVKILDYCIIGNSNTDTLAVTVWNIDTSNEIWITVDGGEWWKKIHQGTNKESIAYFYNKKGNIELVAGGSGGILHLDFTEAWEAQEFNWIQDLETIESGETVDFTRTVGPMMPIPGTSEMLVGARWFTRDKYENGDVKRAKFWKVNFEDQFAYEYKDIQWNDDTTGYHDPKERGYGTTDFIFSFTADPEDTERWWVGEGNEVLYTEDAGQTWETDTFAYHDMWIIYEIVRDPSNDNHLFMVGDGSNLETDDNWSTYKQIGLPGLVLNDMDFYKDANGDRTYFYAGWGQEIYAEDELGNIKGNTRLEYDYPALARIVADPFIEGRAFVTAGHQPGGFIHRTDDFAATEILSFNSVFMSSVRTLEANPIQENEIWFIGDPNFKNPNPTVMKSRYGGDNGSWNPLTISESGEVEYGWHDFLVFDPQDKKTAYSNGLYSVGIDIVGDVLRTEDGGNSWEKFDADNGLPRYNDWIDDLCINPFNNSELFGNTGTWPLVSMDRGETWTEQVMEIEGYDTLFSYSFKEIDYTAIEDVMVGLGSNNDLIISNNKGVNWISLRDNLTIPGHVRLMDVHTDVNSDTSKLLIFCSSFGASMFKLELEVGNLDWENGASTGIQDAIVWNRESFVYPNPTNGQFSVKADQGAELRIYNNAGKLLAYQVIQDTSSYINFPADAADGSYIITLHKKGKIQSDRIILMR